MVNGGVLCPLLLLAVGDSGLFVGVIVPATRVLLGYLLDRGEYCRPVTY